MPQDNNLKTRMNPPKMDHLAEQIIARSKIMDQAIPSKKVLSFPKLWAKPQFSYALAAACGVILLAFVVTNNAPTSINNGTFDVAQQPGVTLSEWDEFLLNEEEVMFAGL